MDFDSLHQVSDVRKVLHVKKVLCESETQSGRIDITNAVSLSGRVIKSHAERKGLLVQENVQVLLMNCVIDFQTGEKYRLESLEELILQEKEWLSRRLSIENF